MTPSLTVGLPPRPPTESPEKLLHVTLITSLRKFSLFMTIR